MNQNQNPNKSSFVKRELSKEDVIIQILRPQLGGRVTQALDVFERLVNEAESLTKLGTMIQPGGERYHITPADLKANLDEFDELLQIATEGRALLNKVGYVSTRRTTPPAGMAPVGETVSVTPVISQLPGEEPLHGNLVQPITKPLIPKGGKGDKKP